MMVSVNRCPFGHNEDPVHNAGPFYVSGIKLDGGSNPVYVKP